ncbi:MAG: outer membrane protein assembly factor BamC [Gammaproteobacteria bacterium]|nr:MAG: outer membrane protein assembly factor BamC [Gammaproteobacteria bacterium]
MKFTTLPMFGLQPSGLRFIAISMVLIVTACANERPVYHGAEYYKNLEIPPDLTAPDTGEDLKVPRPTEEALQRFRDNNKLETVITPKFDGVRTVTYAGNSWIEIDNDVDHVWPRLIEFWETEGIPLAQVRPLLGFMETRWIERLSNDVDGFFNSMLQSSYPDQREKFRVRVERFDHNSKTRLYVSHTRIERRLKSDDADEYIWVTLPSDIEAEREIISRMAIFAGLPKDKTQVLLENYRPYSSLVTTESSNSTTLTMKGSIDFVWRRAVRALDRLGMQEIKEQQNISTITFVVAKPEEKAKKLEGDELAKSSWLMQLFNEANQTASSMPYQLEFTDLGGRIQIEVKDAGNSQTTDEDDDISGTAVVEQIRDALVKYLE